MFNAVIATLRGTARTLFLPRDREGHRYVQAVRAGAKQVQYPTTATGKFDGSDFVEATQRSKPMKFYADGFVVSTHDIFQGNRPHKGVREPEPKDSPLPIGGGRLAYFLQLKSNKPTAVHPLGQGGGCSGNTGVIFGPHYSISKKSRNAPRGPAVGRNAKRAKPST
jgi:hypothetical protein